MKGFDPKFSDFPDYIIRITKEIWEDRGIETLNQYYAPEIPVRTPMGVSVGNQPVIAATMATCHEFPDRQIYTEDVIWSQDESGHFLSSHRLCTTSTHLRDGLFGPATGKAFKVNVIADCAARENAIDDEWLVRDYGGIVAQLGMEPRTFAQDLIRAEGGPEKARPAFTPAMDVPGPYKSTGNGNAWGQRYADSLQRIMGADFNHILEDYDRAVMGHYPGARSVVSREEVSAFWLGLRSSFPSATFTIHHKIGMDEGNHMPPRAAIRWSLDGVHDGWGTFGRPTGAKVHVMGMCHAEFGPWGLRREWALYDEIAIWKQILMQTGEA
ncbi:ester cyclase [Salipiger mangrovisoli]|uniref:Ester cyclase n=1 Tax=Salipiger mangrovisoli TaxID=2865933 RepID=A0ABR9X5X0_9RHOB|nr:ester cyclase [Salipiger mangrovisoli]MBE9638837.1 ester cyclase [Salipiger mangrovisoli]